MLSSRESIVYVALLGVLIIWIVLPIIPAFFLYWFFPNQNIRATGVLANFKINAAGAFAGYLVLFAAMIPFVNKTYDIVGDFLHPYWTVRGQINILDKNGQPIHGDELFQQIKIRTQPEISSFHESGFVIGLPVAEKDFPTIVFEIPKFGTYVLRMKSVTEISRDDFNKLIELQNPISIRDESHNISYEPRPQ